MSAPLEKAFKTVDGLSISLDIYLPRKATAELPVPVLLWWHGGGLLQGSRKDIAPHLQRAPELHDICVVSADYRLAPQTRLPGILSDVRDAVNYVQSKDFESITQNKANNKKLIVSGSSAGGWLALLAGSQLGFKDCNVAPYSSPVTAVVAIYPITDITAPFFTTKQRPVSYMNGRIIDGPKELGKFLDPAAPASASSSSDSPRSGFYHYMIQEALLSGLLLDGTSISSKTFTIAAALRNGIISMPPTLMTHGTEDDKVPISQAEDVLAALQERGIEAHLIREQGENHLYDRDGEEEMKEMYAFIRRLTD
ncbi:hypothetical protein CBS101457_000838 [Exobasidium rhododendri]|nr:hypothetical protein CBS101457_000838 [Exobasidium rhododendri]